MPRMMAARALRLAEAIDGVESGLRASAPQLTVSCVSPPRHRVWQQLKERRERER